MTWQSLKPHTGLWPLFAIMSAGMVFVGAYIVRLATKTTDIQGRSNSTVTENDRTCSMSFIL